MSGPNILFVADAGAAVGGGHVMRSLTLAGALADQGAHCRFVTPPAVEAILAAFAPNMPRAPAEGPSPADLAAAARREAFDAIVFDHYGLSEDDHRGMARGKPALVIDDLADRPLGADLLLDSGPTRRAEDYLGLTPEGVRLLLGPQYAPVRPEFAALRDTALGWRGEPVGRVLVSLGLTDVDGITGRVVEKLRPKVNEVGIDVVLGAEAPSLPSLTKIARRDIRIVLHVDTPLMAQLTAEADIAIGAAGSSTWERCALGLPTLMLVLAENQREAAQAVAERGAALVLDAGAAGFEAAFDRALMRLTTDAALRRQLSQASAELCDGLGAPRVAEVFLKLIAARG
ncbi:UDP-2,4-diacetamido-2,4,6-trideoxy-beta-L-altropyranose hydrolase [Phenylobacterium sp.]|uniref:UDP-2,4-diacetamido-2,4, 6-trideoxy-beta-L-altropyranose hydrolase n=1 Tax=Phenylobacterium sp. TaxID=1871053 RepID=UPI001219BDC7|nr:UDP-2,4-diacetamido-2,4,6-trideoxy-beta-L-altropyranose hydrolase [Phenylobacterium sp.]THD64092.1 MAG: UDP-2,4-diacetamido-2,4,6-trideoxy-beta-L-altropyranose hydrolase [Phenylobacterium sp.]